MSDTDPLAPVLGASDPGHPTQQGPRRTLRGALATVALIGGLIAALAAPTAMLVGALLVPAAVAIAALVVNYVRRRSQPSTRLCVPGTDYCVRV